MTTASSGTTIAATHRQATRDTTSTEPQWREKLRDGTTVLIRPIHATDIELERRFIEALSPESRRLRFLGQVGTPSPALLAQLTNPDPRLDAASLGHSAGLPDIEHHLDIMSGELDIADQRLHHIVGCGE